MQRYHAGYLLDHAGVVVRVGESMETTAGRAVEIHCLPQFNRTLAPPPTAEQLTLTGRRQSELGSAAEICRARRVRVCLR